ncbi:hypothetical protein QBC33DRAFT_525070 [Phialemonium atrogriseum]|uniref:EngB-type G domain-containing protein n=1 Tax=Phialemonium atrogriseum TaxID=1093897 RepID=A0AAJ0C986_9PEZI|nr:uncharacterized protein QBC33DRAFT_525070 [Phialemonium atrogriseum]KAK1771872.1 hypothetical protein QBC33DRAFT_525070 [Phialemonium atrogriseum]
MRVVVGDTGGGGGGDGSAVAEAVRGGGRSTRSERRGTRNVREPLPRHSLVLMDMPGYGLNSKAEWGTEIAKYLGRRAMLRGAVLLVDAVAGVKSGDRMVLGMLRDAGVRTAVVLTKADKLGYGATEAGESAVKGMCLRVWEELRAVEKSSLTWLEGEGWEREIWVTGAGDPKNGGVGVEGARLAICRMAGLIEDNRMLDVPHESPTGKIVPFDQLQWAPSSTPNSTPSSTQTIPTPFQSIPQSATPVSRPRGRTHRASF